MKPSIDLRCGDCLELMKDIPDGILCQGRLRISPQAQGLIWALSSLRWDEK